MNDHNEKEELLTFGNITIDVSNVPYGKILNARKMWDKLLKNKDITAQQVDRGSEKIGLYLIRQPLIVLNRRFTNAQCIIEYIKRLLFTTGKIRRSTETQYNEFQDWVYFKLIGKKKARLERQAGILDLIENMVVSLEKDLNISQDECLELLQTLASEQGKELTTFIQDQRAS